SMEEMLREMDDAGIDVGVVPGRHRAGTEIPNEVLKQLVEAHRGRFAALASVDVLDTARGAAMIDTAVKSYRFPGIALDLGVLGMTVDDRRVYPIYEHCAKHGCFIAITLSLMGARDLDLIHPAQLDRAARDFPGVNFVSAHGSHPYVLEVIGVAMKRENVWIAPDMYMLYAPGRDLYVQAAQGYLQDRILFGTGYPYTPLEESVERFLALPLPATFRDKVLYRNAERVLKRPS